MKRPVTWEKILRQQNAPRVQAAGDTWERRVAAMERMNAAMKRSGWPARKEAAAEAPGRHR